MTTITKAEEEDYKLLADIGKVTFIESHGSSAASSDIDMYVNENCTDEILKEEISDRKNIYHIIYHDRQPAGYSKIVFNVPYSNIGIENVTKLDRIYLLKEF